MSTSERFPSSKVIDTIVPEPLGGAHRAPEKTATNVADAIAKALSEFEGRTPDEIRRQRHERFMEIGRTI